VLSRALDLLSCNYSRPAPCICWISVLCIVTLLSRFTFRDSPSSMCGTVDCHVSKTHHVQALRWSHGVRQSQQRAPALPLSHTTMSPFAKPFWKGRRRTWLVGHKHSRRQIVSARLFPQKRCQPIASGCSATLFEISAIERCRCGRKGAQTGRNLCPDRRSNNR
jgi:hypothetical protein